MHHFRAEFVGPIFQNRSRRMPEQDREGFGFLSVRQTNDDFHRKYPLLSSASAAFALLVGIPVPLVAPVIGWMKVPGCAHIPTVYHPLPGKTRLAGCLDGGESHE
jgi:hypothetical protein